MQAIDESTPPGPAARRTAAEDRRLQPYYDAMKRCSELYKKLGYPLIWNMPEYRANPFLKEYFIAMDLFETNPRAAREALEALNAKLELLCVKLEDPRAACEVTP